MLSRGDRPDVLAMRGTTMTARARIALVAAALVVTASVGAVGLGWAQATAGARTSGTAATANVARPRGFDHPRRNPYFPLRPGTVTTLRGNDEGERLDERVTITHTTKLIQGVRTRVVRDVVRRSDGSLAEKTHDFYANDNAGNVWYFGEATATYDRHGKVVSREGSWQAGVHGARRGLIMPAHPRPTLAFRQEFFVGHAEDQAWIVQNDATVRVPAGEFDRVVRSFEWTRLEPGVLSVKFYAPGVGILREKDVAGGAEVFVLVSVTHR